MLGKKSETGSNSLGEEHFRDAIHRGHRALVDWILKTAAVQDMDRLIEENKKKAPRNLIQLLRSSLNEDVAFEDNKINAYVAEANECWSRCSVPCLSMVILARLVDVVVPSCSSSLIAALSECFHILYLIDKGTLTENIQDKKRFVLAQDLWMSTDFKCHWFFKKIIEPFIKRCDKKSVTRPLTAACQIIEEIMKTSEKEYLEAFGLHTIANMIKKENFESLYELHEFLEVHFVGMFYFFLGKLPKVIEICVFESSVEEFGRLKFCGDKSESLTYDSGNISGMGSDENI